MNAIPSARAAIYPLPYAAALAGLSAVTARRWMRGYGYHHNGVKRRSSPILAAENPAADALSFEQLLTLRLVRAFREDAKLSLPTIKSAARIAAVHYGVDNPFVTKRFRTDGRKVFLELSDAASMAADERVLIEVMTGQRQFHAVVEPSLFENVVFVGDAAAEWRPLGLSRSVVIRPDRAFGAPHIDGTGVRPDVLAQAVMAEGGAMRRPRQLPHGSGLACSRSAMRSLRSEPGRVVTRREIRFRR